MSFIQLLLVFVMSIALLISMWVLRSRECKFNSLPVYLISLKGFENRKQNITRYVSPLETNAILGSDLSRQDLVNKGFINQSCKLKLGEIGCFLSHIYFLNKSLDYPYTLIIEDDVDLSNINNLNQTINNIISLAPDDADVISLSYNHHELKNNNSIVIDNKHLLKPVKLIYGTQCLLVKTKNIAKKLENFIPINLPYDIALPLVLNTYIVEPQLFKLSSFASHSSTQSIKYLFDSDMFQKIKTK